LSSSVCLTIDVEDFFEGMEVLGHHVERPSNAPGGLMSLLSDIAELDAPDGTFRITLFVVASYAPRIRSSLEAFIEAGHEIASHGPDHGLLPAQDIVLWLRRGRLSLEDLLGVAVRGFRSPRFDLPGDGSLSRYRDELAAAGYEYVSDRHSLGVQSPVRELPVLTWRGMPIGGGSYQRLLPVEAVGRAVERRPGQSVLYYHSYDFDSSLPCLRDVRSLALAKQLLGRKRVRTVFLRMAERFGSESCGHARP
jgi:hypothetical protein